VKDALAKFLDLANRPASQANPRLVQAAALELVAECEAAVSVPDELWALVPSDMRPGLLMTLAAAVAASA
jgi:hypothetical protein